MEKTLTLESLFGAPAAQYMWPLPMSEKQDGAIEIVETIRWVCQDFPELNAAVDNHILKDYDTHDYHSMRNICERYNRAVAAILDTWLGSNRYKRIPERASSGLLKHILNQVYTHAVCDPDKLNVYEPFSPEVYGETSYDLVKKMLETIAIRETDTFIDLGSGVGQVVLQIAASTECRFSFGIERAETPSSYAINMEREFRKWMAWYGKSYGEFKLEKGDFLDDSMSDRIANASVVFVNNYAFGPIVNHQLKLRFANMKESARIVSSKEFVRPNFRITSRALSDISSIMRVTEIEGMRGSVSWTVTPVSYYLHTIDRTQLELYFKENRERGSHRGRGEADFETDTSDTGSSSLRGYQRRQEGGGDGGLVGDSATVSETSSSVAELCDDIVWGPTTRRQWKQLVAQESHQKEDKSKSRGLPLQTIKEHREKSTTKKSILLKNNKNAKETSKKNVMSGNNLIALDLLHRETINSTRSPCPISDVIDDDVEEKPNVIVSEPQDNEFNRFMGNLRNLYASYFEKIKNPNFVEIIQKKIEAEKEKQKALVYKQAVLSRQIDSLRKESVDLLQDKLLGLGISAANPQQIIDQAQTIIEKHRDLTEKVEIAETQLQFAENENHRLNKLLKVEAKQLPADTFRKSDLKSQLNKLETDVSTWERFEAKLKQKVVAEKERLPLASPKGVPHRQRSPSSTPSPRTPQMFSVESLITSQYQSTFFNNPQSLHPVQRLSDVMQPDVVGIQPREMPFGYSQQATLFGQPQLHIISPDSIKRKRDSSSSSRKSPKIAARSKSPGRSGSARESTLAYSDIAQGSSHPYVIRKIRNEGFPPSPVTTQTSVIAPAVTAIREGDPADAEVARVLASTRVTSCSSRITTPSPRLMPIKQRILGCKEETRTPIPMSLEDKVSLMTQRSDSLPYSEGSQVTELMYCKIIEEPDATLDSIMGVSLEPVSGASGIGTSLHHNSSTISKGTDEEHKSPQIVIPDSSVSKATMVYDDPVSDPVPIATSAQHIKLINEVSKSTTIYEQGRPLDGVPKAIDNITNTVYAISTPDLTESENISKAVVSQSSGLEPVLPVNIEDIRNLHNANAVSSSISDENQLGIVPKVNFSDGIVQLTKTYINESIEPITISDGRKSKSTVCTNLSVPDVNKNNYPDDIIKSIDDFAITTSVVGAQNISDSDRYLADKVENKVPVCNSMSNLAPHSMPRLPEKKVPVSDSYEQHETTLPTIVASETSQQIQPHVSMPQKDSIDFQNLDIPQVKSGFIKPVVSDMDPCKQKISQDLTIQSVNKSGEIKGEIGLPQTVRDVSELQVEDENKTTVSEKQQTRGKSEQQIDIPVAELDQAANDIIIEPENILATIDQCVEGLQPADIDNGSGGESINGNDDTVSGRKKAKLRGKKGKAKKSKTKLRQVPSGADQLVSSNKSQTEISQEQMDSNQNNTDNLEEHIDCQQTDGHVDISKDQINSNSFQIDSTPIQIDDTKDLAAPTSQEEIENLQPKSNFVDSSAVDIGDDSNLLGGKGYNISNDEVFQSVESLDESPPVRKTRSQSNLGKATIGKSTTKQQQLKLKFKKSKGKKETGDQGEDEDLRALSSYSPSLPGVEKQTGKQGRKKSVIQNESVITDDHSLNVSDQKEAKVETPRQLRPRKRSGVRILESSDASPKTPELKELSAIQSPKQQIPDIQSGKSLPEKSPTRGRQEDKIEESAQVELEENILDPIDKTPPEPETDTRKKLRPRNRKQSSAIPNLPENNAKSVRKQNRVAVLAPSIESVPLEVSTVKLPATDGEDKTVAMDVDAKHGRSLLDEKVSPGAQLPVEPIEDKLLLKPVCEGPEQKSDQMSPDKHENVQPEQNDLKINSLLSSNHESRDNSIPVTNVADKKDSLTLQHSKQISSTFAADEIRITTQTKYAVNVESSLTKPNISESKDMLHLIRALEYSSDKTQQMSSNRNDYAVEPIDEMTKDIAGEVQDVEVTEKSPINHLQSTDELFDTEVPLHRAPGILSLETSGTTDKGSATTAVTDGIMPLSNATTVVTDGTTPLGNTTTYVTDGTTPLSSATTAGTNWTTPLRNATTDVTDGTTPLGNATTDVTDGTTPLGNAITAVTDGTTPLDDATTAVTDGTMPLGNTETPGKVGTMPLDDATTAVTDGTTPLGNAITAVTDGTTPLGDATTAVTDGTMPMGNTETPGKDRTMPLGDATTAGEDGTTSLDIATTAGSVGLCNSESHQNQIEHDEVLQHANTDLYDSSKFDNTRTEVDTTVVSDKCKSPVRPLATWHSYADEFTSKDSRKAVEIESRERGTGELSGNFRIPKKQSIQPTTDGCNDRPNVSETSSHSTSFSQSHVSAPASPCRKGHLPWIDKHGLHSSPRSHALKGDALLTLKGGKLSGKDKTAPNKPVGIVIKPSSSSTAQPIEYEEPKTYKEYRELKEKGVLPTNPTKDKGGKQSETKSKKTDVDGKLHSSISPSKPLAKAEQAKQHHEQGEHHGKHRHEPIKTHDIAKHKQSEAELRHNHRSNTKLYKSHEDSSSTQTDPRIESNKLPGDIDSSNSNLDPSHRGERMLHDGSWKDQTSSVEGHSVPTKDEKPRREKTFEEFRKEQYMEAERCVVKDPQQFIHSKYGGEYSHPHFSQRNPHLQQRYPRQRSPNTYQRYPQYNQNIRKPYPQHHSPNLQKPYPQNRSPNLQKPYPQNRSPNLQNVRFPYRNPNLHHKVPPSHSPTLHSHLLQRGPNIPSRFSQHSPNYSPRFSSGVSRPGDTRGNTWSSLNIPTSTTARQYQTKVPTATTSYLSYATQVETTSYTTKPEEATSYTYTNPDKSDYSQISYASYFSQTPPPQQSYLATYASSDKDAVPDNTTTSYASLMDPLTYQLTGAAIPTTYSVSNAVPATDNRTYQTASYLESQAQESCLLMTSQLPAEIPTYPSAVAPAAPVPAVSTASSYLLPPQPVPPVTPLDSLYNNAQQAAQMIIQSTILNQNIRQLDQHLQSVLKLKQQEALVSGGVAQETRDPEVPSTGYGELDSTPWIPGITCPPQEAQRPITLSQTLIPFAQAISVGGTLLSSVTGHRSDTTPVVSAGSSVSYHDDASYPPPPPPPPPRAPR